MKQVSARIAIGLWLLLPFGAAWADDIYQAPDLFVAESFGGVPPEPNLLWLTAPVQEGVQTIMGRKLKQLRLRYWAGEGRTVWVLDEIGKVKPITAGFVVKGGEIERMRVLIFRESHGWEVRYPVFADQFQGLSLVSDLELSEGIDGISGATLSVNALRRLARLALYLHGQTPEGAREGVDHGDE